MAKFCQKKKHWNICVHGHGHHKILPFKGHFALHRSLIYFCALHKLGHPFQMKVTRHEKQADNSYLSPSFFQTSFHAQGESHRLSKWPFALLFSSQFTHCATDLHPANYFSNPRLHSSSSFVLFPVPVALLFSSRFNCSALPTCTWHIILVISLSPFF